MSVIEPGEESQVELIVTERKENIGIITLNHDRKRNALGKALIHELIAALNNMIHQRERVVIPRATQGAPVWWPFSAISASARPPPLSPSPRPKSASLIIPPVSYISLISWAWPWPRRCSSPPTP